jgi:hypothetical protein
MGFSITAKFAADNGKSKSDDVPTIVSGDAQ